MILAACETHWLYGALPGLNRALTALIVTVGIALARRAAGKGRGYGVVTALGCACLIGAAAAVTADPAYELLIAAAVLFALGAALMADYAAGRALRGPLSWVLAAPAAAPLAAAEAGSRFTEAAVLLRAGSSLAVLRGIALALPVTAFLALLLSQADPTLAAWRDLLRDTWREVGLLPRGLFFGVATVCLLGTFGMALRPAPQVLRARAAEAIAHPLGDTERLIMLGSVSGLFALFLLLQVSYLFGNPGGRTGSGVSYADAVHRGFVELNVAASVCGALLLLTARYSRPGARARWLKPLEGIVTLQAQILLVSAFYRVMLYEEAYGFTRLRLLVQVYAAVAFVLLCLLSIELRGVPQPDRLLRRSLVVASLALAVLVYGNSDAWIARANLLRYSRTGRIDVPYLTAALGTDAVPELVRQLPRLPEPLALQIASGVRARYSAAAAASWYEWSVRRAALRRALTTLRDDPQFAGTKAAHAAPPLMTDGTSARTTPAPPLTD